MPFVFTDARSDTDFLDTVTGKQSAVPAVKKGFVFAPDKKTDANYNKLESGIVGLVHGGASGFLEEGVAGLKSNVTRPIAQALDKAIYGDEQSVLPDVDYTQERDRLRSNVKAIEAANPNSFMAGDITGAIVTPLNKLAGPGGGFVKTVSQGTGLGAAQAAGRSEADLVDDPWKLAFDTAIGGGIGGVAGGLFYGIGKAAMKLAPRIQRLFGKSADQVDPDTARAVQIMLDDGKTPKEIEAAVKRSIESQRTVPQTVFETADSPAAMGLQEVMTGQPSQAGTFMKEFNRARIGKNVPEAMGQFTKGATTTSPVTAAQNVQAAADDIINSAIKTRTEAVRPLYENVAPKKVPPTLLKSLTDKHPVLAAELTKAGKDPVVRQLAGDLPENSIGFLDAVKKGLDGKISVAQRQGDTAAVKAYQEAKTALVNALDEYAPAYGKARAEFEGMSPVVTRLKDSLIGKIANAKDEKSLINAVFNELPDNITQARNIFYKTGKAQQWDDLVASHIETLVEGTKGSLPKLLTKFQDNPKLRAAMGDESYKGMQALMGNMRRIERTLPKGSNTVEKAQYLDKLMEGAGEHIPNLADQRTMTTRALDWIGRQITSNASKEAVAAQNARNLKLAKVITSPDMAEYLKALKGKSAQEQMRQTLLWLDTRLAGATSAEGAGRINKATGSAGMVTQAPRRIVVRPSGKQ